MDLFLLGAQNMETSGVNVQINKYKQTRNIAVDN